MSLRTYKQVFAFHRQCAGTFAGKSLLKTIRKVLFLGTTCAVAMSQIVNSAYAVSIQNPVSIFSTYPSDALNALCKAEAQKENCIEDAIAPAAFVNAIQATQLFSSLAPFNEGSDYEVLIANLGTTTSHGNAQFVEFTLQWRGIEIDSATFTEWQQTPSQSNIIDTLVAKWVTHIKQQNVFSSRYLYSALEASNYENSLTVPDSIGEFTKLDTQLYSDPFNGAITRYTHPAYEDALVDVTVYPILGSLETADNVLLNKQLNEDLEKANSVAQAQQLTLSLPAPASPYTVSPAIQGWRLGLKAESDTTPTIYASTYVFRQEDKIVKVATTFPTDFSDPLVNELLAHVQVPKESALMKNIRAMLSESIN